MEKIEEKRKIKTFVINLIDQVDRKRYMLETISKYPLLDIEFVAGVNGKKFSEEEAKKRFNLKRFYIRQARLPYPGEIGCTLSHRLCYEKFLQSDDDVALILEDDLQVVQPENFEYILKKSSEILAKESAGVITFSRHTLYYPKSQLTLGREYSLFQISCGWGTCAYLINKKAARIMMSPKRPFIVADEYEYMHGRGICVRGLYPNLTRGLSEIAQMETTVCAHIHEGNRPLWHRLYRWLPCKYRALLVHSHILKIRKIITREMINE